MWFGKIEAIVQLNYKSFFSLMISIFSFINILFDKPQTSEILCFLPCETPYHCNLFDIYKCGKRF